MDVSTAFINADLDRDDVYFNLPPGPSIPEFTSPDGTPMVLHAKRALYGMPQAPRLWNRRLTDWLNSQGFVASSKDPCLFTAKYDNGDEIHLICYVDDIAFAGNNPDAIAKFKAELSAEFKMSDLGSLNWFLGCEVIQDLVKGTTKLVQTSYINDVVGRFSDHLTPGVKVSTPCAPDFVYTEDDCPSDPAAADKQYMWRSLYRSLVGCLLYASVLSRTDITYDVAQLSRFVSNPGPNHWNQAIRVLTYLRDTADIGITYTRSADPSIANKLFLFVDATWADCPDNRRSTSGIICMLNGGAVSWSSKKQEIVAQSSCESELIAACAGANDAMFIRYLLEDIGAPQGPTRVYEDNRATRIIVQNPGILRKRSRHFEVRFYKVQEYETRGLTRMVQVPTLSQLADLLTKNTTTKIFLRLRNIIMGDVPFHHHLFTDD